MPIVSFRCLAIAAGFAVSACAAPTATSNPGTDTASAAADAVSFGDATLDAATSDPGAGGGNDAPDAAHDAADATVDATTDAADAVKPPDATPLPDAAATDGDAAATADAAPTTDAKDTANATADADATLPTDAPALADTKDAADAVDAKADTADVSLPPPPGKVGACKLGAPGYGSCWTKAFVQCLQPGATCASDLSTSAEGNELFNTKWSNGSALECVTKIIAGNVDIQCTGKGPDGIACLSVHLTSLGEMPGPGTVTGPNGTHKATPGAAGSTVITCQDGSKETYAKPEDLCYPLQAGVCEVNTGGGG